MSNDLKMTEDLTKAIADAVDPAQIRAAVQDELAKQLEIEANAAKTAETDAAAKVAADAAAKVVADAVAVEAAKDAAFTRTENIGGKEFTFTAASELELERQVSNALRVAYAVQPVATEKVVETPRVDPEAARLAAEADVTAKADLELKFKRGDITAADYLEQSGAIKTYLEKQGVPLADLQTEATKRENERYATSWNEATEEFKNGPAGKDWPGGPINLEIIGGKLAMLGLTDAQDKVAALAQAWNIMKSENKYVPYTPPVKTEDTSADAAAKAVADAAATKAAADAKILAEATAIVEANKKTASGSSSIFGASSGEGAEIKTAPNAAGKVDVPADASPTEIMAAYNKALVASGKNPNEAFAEAFGARR